MELNLCLGCMKKKESNGPCPHCGFDETSYVPEPHHLPPGTILCGKYLLGRVLGEGGFGITYIGWDLVLELKVAVKEYYPSGMVARNAAASLGVSLYTAQSNADFFHGRDKFLREAKSLAKFDETPGIVKVKDFFQENDTAYIVMEYVEGITMKQFVEKNGGRLPAARVFELILPVAEALEVVHKAGIIHRDISPDNIMVKNNNQVKLLDFGAAKDLAANISRSLIVLLKPGYAPEEQYRLNGELGPWTDVYALCATMYYCMTGRVPPEALERLSGVRMQPPSELGADLSGEQEAILLKGLEVDSRDRYQSMKELVDSLRNAPTAPLAGEVILPSEQNRERRSRHSGRRKGGETGKRRRENAGTGNNGRKAGGFGGRRFLIVSAAILVLAFVFFSGKNRDSFENRPVRPGETVPESGRYEKTDESMEWEVKLPDSDGTLLDSPEGDQTGAGEPPAAQTGAGEPPAAQTGAEEPPAAGKSSASGEITSSTEAAGLSDQQSRDFSDEVLGAAEYGNYPANIENGGLVNFYERNGELYLFLCDPGETLYQLYMGDDSLPVPVADNIGYLNVAGDYLYCINTEENRIYRMDLSGKPDAWQLEKLSGKPAAGYLNLVNSWLYYLDPQDHPCRIRTDGTDSSYKRLSDRSVREYQVMDGWGYCIDENGRALRVKNDGTSEQELSGEKVYMLNASEGRLYMVLEHSLVRAGADGSNPKTILDKSIYAVNVNQNWIYYTDGEDGKKLYRCSLNGGFVEKVRDEHVKGNINICGLVYFFTIEEDQTESFMMFWPED